ncbi:MAG TPA: DUF429 domain-containing protein [Actinocatenispora sp.]
MRTAQLPWYDQGMATYLGVDLAWADGAGRVNETGVAALDAAGTVLAAGWTRGVAETVDWIERHARDEDTVLFVDAPLLVDNPRGQRLCERQVGQRYGRWYVSANSTNQATPRLAGVRLLGALATTGWVYDDGRVDVDGAARRVSECYPYTTLVGAAELGYEQRRPAYKRRPRRAAPGWRVTRAEVCDDLIVRLGGLRDADPPLVLDSHPTTADLARAPSPTATVAYKHREDLIDAVLCAWTAALWHRHGPDRCQVLGPTLAESAGAAATIIAPARAEQGRPVRGRG